MFSNNCKSIFIFEVATGEWFKGRSMIFTQIKFFDLYFGLFAMFSYGGLCYKSLVSMRPIGIDVLTCCPE